MRFNSCISTSFINTPSTGSKVKQLQYPTHDHGGLQHALLLPLLHSVSQEILLSYANVFKNTYTHAPLYKTQSLGGEICAEPRRAGSLLCEIWHSASFVIPVFFAVVSSPPAPKPTSRQSVMVDGDTTHKDRPNCVWAYFQMTFLFNVKGILFNKQKTGTCQCFKMSFCITGKPANTVSMKNDNRSTVDRLPLFVLLREQWKVELIITAAPLHSCIIAIFPH